MDARLISQDLLKYSATHNPRPPPRLGTRYGRRGGFLPEPGNTIVCHLEKGSATQALLVAARARYLEMPEAERFLFTPVTSMHMTLFQGVIEYRRKPRFWPEDIPLETPIEDMTEIMAARLEGFSTLDPFQVAVKSAKPSGLVVEGKSENDRRAMKAWRDALARLLGYRHLDHDDYAFHITFAYVIERLSDAALPAWQLMLDEVTAEIQRAAPVLQLRPPAFCSFEDMNHFHELMIFDSET
ncbi:hypothetical protein F4695_002192 [Rhizobium soli]|uniref:DUF1868 domain-containing protein n=1 Tax=Rhizobium soli TaxID=424798 RepID=A0A7X0JJR2_9HYPH|nr:DUF1868 domain-containing protein [Rhizobium soli]MBB6508843.1 hypothetical protein [Rhizobium soli]